MKFTIKHETRGRIRVHLHQYRMSCDQANTLLYYFRMQKQVTDVKVYEQTQDMVIYFAGSRRELLQQILEFTYDQVEVPEHLLESSDRALCEQYKEKLVCKVLGRCAMKAFLPGPVRVGLTCLRAAKYIKAGIMTLAQGKLQVPVLDATAISVSLVRGDMNTAGSIMFLLGIGELLEEWTHKKSVDDLARSMSLQVEKVWTLQEGKRVLKQTHEVQEGDLIFVHMGNVIPFDGVVTDGDAMVNQSSLTGEFVPARRTASNMVYAGTVVEEGELTICVKQTSGASKFEQIVKMIEESEKLKSGLESKAEHLADRLVPYTLAGSVLVWALTRNATKALSMLMVDFSCALKLAMPISVLSAIREAGQHQITVKGGKYLEAMAEADTIVFDKTGTLTKATPTVVDVISFNGDEPEELLRLAACMEEHFPHSMAKAVVDAAADRELVHEETHSKVEYIVAHGISTNINGKKAIIGSNHFVFEDEGCQIPEGMEERFREIPGEYSCLYLAIEGKLAAVICIEDPLREEAAAVIKALKQAGIRNVVMMTGDSERTAAAIAAKVSVDQYYSEVLPEDKVRFVEEQKAAGHKVIMIGDGINDSPALSAADVGIAISEGAQLAREIADVTIGADDLYEIVALRDLSRLLMKRIQKNYGEIVGFNTGLILLGVTGILQPTTTALLHNTSTLLIGLNSMQPLLS